MSDKLTTTRKAADAATPALAAYSLNKPEELSGLATLLQHHIQDKRLYTDIQGKKHVNVEGWQFAGAMLGIVPIVEKVEDTSTHQEHTFKGYQGKPDTKVCHTEFRATVALQDLRSGQVIGRGIASCSNIEAKKRTFDPYAVESMAQTRAVGKAFRMLIAWIMQAGGYATTPAEEMPDAEPETNATVVVDITPLATEAQKAELVRLMDAGPMNPETATTWRETMHTATEAQIQARISRLQEHRAAAAGMTVEQFLSQPSPNA